VNIQLPPWPATAPTCGSVALREFSARDIPMIQELATDPYVPLIGSLPAQASFQQAQDWVDRQLLRQPGRSWPRLRSRRAARPDGLRVEHPGAAQDRALHRTLEYWLGEDSRAGGV